MEIAHAEEVAPRRLPIRRGAPAVAAQGGTTPLTSTQERRKEAREGTAAVVFLMMLPNLKTLIYLPNPQLDRLVGDFFGGKAGDGCHRFRTSGANAGCRVLRKPIRIR